MSTLNIEAEVLTPTEACAFLKISRPTLDEYTEAGDIPVIKFGRIVRYSKASLLALEKVENKRGESPC